MEHEEINKKLDLIIEEEGYETPEWIYAIWFVVGFVVYGIFQKLLS